MLTRDDLINHIIFMKLKDEAQRNRILEHCRTMYAREKSYANWAFDNYARMLPWLKLERKQ